MFGSKEVKDAWYAISGFGLLFEVNEDPEDASIHREHAKSLCIWILAWESGGDAQLRAMSLPDLMKQDPSFVGTITRNTVPEARKWSVSTLKTGWITVIVTPSLEWEPHYAHRVYPAIKITPGFRGNFAVSIPARQTLAGPPSSGAGSTSRPGLKL